MGELVTQMVQEARRNGQDKPPRRQVAAALDITEHRARTLIDEAAHALDAHVGEPVTQAPPTTAHPGDPADTRANPGRLPGRWPLALIGIAAAVAIWGGWVDLGQLTGFGIMHPLPGLPGWLGDLRIDTAIVLPIGIEAYGLYALRVHLSSAVLSARTRDYARRSAWASLGVGAGAQVASHLLSAAGITAAPWGVTVVVACVPVAVLGLATGLAARVRRDTHPGGDGR
jgi:hypothetical protein